MSKHVLTALVVLGCLCGRAHANCYMGIASACERGYCLDIQWNCEVLGYEDDVAITIWPAKREKNAEGELTSVPAGREKRFRFLRECQWNSDSQDSFSCHKGGRTLLAGRTYKSQKHGMSQSCTDLGSGQTTMVPTYRFVCISGCSSKSTFRYLRDDFKSNCD